MVLRLGEEGLIRGLLSNQQQAFFQQPYPSLATRRRRLQALRRFVVDHREAICTAIAEDYGHRSRHETLVTEILPVLKEIQHVLSHLRGWMRGRTAAAPLRVPVAKTVFGGRVLPTGDRGQACGAPITKDEKEGVGYECNNGRRRD